MWIVVDRWLGRLLTLSSFVIVGRLLSPEDMSRVAWVLFFTTVAGLLTESGIASVLISDKVVTPERLGAARSASNVVALAIIFSSIIVGVFFYVANDWSQGIAIATTALGHVFIPAISVPYALASRSMNFRVLAMRRCTAQLFGAVAGISAAWAGLGACSFSLQYVIASIISWLVLRSSMAKRGGSRGWLVKVDTQFLGAGIRVLGSGFIGFVSLQTYVLALPAVAPRQQAGYVVFVLVLFSVAQDLVGTLLGNAYWPILARLSGGGDEPVEAVRSALSIGLRLSVAASLVGVGICSLIFVPVMGEHWTPSLPLLVTMLLCLPGLTWVQTNRAWLLARGRYGLELLLTVESVLTLIPLFMFTLMDGMVWVGIGFGARTLLMVAFRLARIVMARERVVPGEWWRAAGSVALIPLGILLQCLGSASQYPYGELVAVVFVLAGLGFFAPAIRPFLRLASTEALNVQ